MKMSQSINLYGDQRIATATGHGIDIASQRADDLDLLAVGHIHTMVSVHRPVFALDVGCGHGGQAARMAFAGAVVLAIDSEDYQLHVTESMRREGVFSEFGFYRVSVEDEPELGPFEVIVCQRMIHYLRHDAAKSALDWFHHIASDDARLFISASGMDSELGDGYEGKEVPAHDRFSRLAPAMADKHSIHPPVCLYRKDELEALVAGAGWIVEKAFLSPFGNVKVVARKGSA